jgi:hypothetical protein
MARSRGPPDLDTREHTTMSTIVVHGTGRAGDLLARALARHSRFRRFEKEVTTGLPGPFDDQLAGKTLAPVSGSSQDGLPPRRTFTGSIARPAGGPDLPWRHRRSGPGAPDRARPRVPRAPRIPAPHPLVGVLMIAQEEAPRPSPLRGTGSAGTKRPPTTAHRARGTKTAASWHHAGWRTFAKSRPGPVVRALSWSPAHHAASRCHLRSPRGRATAMERSPRSPHDRDRG